MASAALEYPSCDPESAASHAASPAATVDSQLSRSEEPAALALVQDAGDASNARAVVQAQPGTLERMHGWTEKASKGLTAAALAHQAGFVAAKAGTKLGLGIARFATKASLTLPAMAVDAAMGTAPANPWSRDPASRSLASLSGVAGAGVDALFNFVDTITHGSIGVGESLSELGLAASHRGVDQLRTALSSDVVRSLTTFTRLLKSEWSVTTDERLPPGGLPAFDNTTIARALLCWISLQAVHRPQIERDVMAEMTLVRQSQFARPHSSSGASGGPDAVACDDDMHDEELRALSAAHRVQRLVTHARLMLAVYGGAFMLLLDHDGVVATRSPASEAVLFVKDCITRGNSILGRTYELPRLPPAAAEEESYYNGEPHRDYSHPSSWNTEGIPYSQLLRGDLDDSLLHVAAGVDPSKAVRGSYDALDNPTEVQIAPEDLDQEAELDATVGPDGVPTTTSRPRYYVITSDHAHKVTLVLRGTVTAGDVATDLTCRAVPASPLGAHLPPNSQAHEGVLKTTLALGLPGRPLHAAVWKQLQSHPDYDVELVGHSLGASVVAALALLWADPATGKTLLSIERAGRHVAAPVDDGPAQPAASAIQTRALHAFAYACPPTFDPALAQFCKPIITAFVCNNDLVPRLSHQSVLGIRNAIAWISYWDTEAQRQQATSSPAAPSAVPALRPDNNDLVLAGSVSGSVASTVAPSVSATETATEMEAETETVEETQAETQHEQTEDSSAAVRAATTSACPVPQFSTLGLLRKTLEHQSGRLGGPFTHARVDFERDVQRLYSALQAKAPAPELVIPGRVFAAYDRNALMEPPPTFDAAPEESATAAGSQPDPVQARIYEVTGDRSKAFGQILFGTGMLEAHFPRVYARVLTQLLDEPAAPASASASHAPPPSLSAHNSAAASTAPAHGTTAATDDARPTLVPDTPPGRASDTEANAAAAIQTATALAAAGAAQADAQQRCDSPQSDQLFHEAAVVMNDGSTVAP